MARKLNQNFLYSLRAEFPFLRGWEPHQLNNANRPVTFNVSRRLDPNIQWKLEFGRRNDSIDNSYTNGVTAVAVSDGKSLEWHDLNEGETTPADVLKDDTLFVLVKYEYRSQLVNNDPGNVEYTLYKRVQETVAMIKENDRRTAQNMREQLEA